jgi:hypothetical protein
MLQSWNKFCMREGAIEISARLPGRHSQAGLWPAFWLMGNLGRATYTRSTDGLWPWNYEECAPTTAECDASQCTLQRISACDPNPGFGLNPYQGRGAPEIDVLEAMPGSGNRSYAGDYEYGCPAADQSARMAAFNMKPFVSTSLIAAPGLPHGSDQRPAKGCLPVNGTEWYPSFNHAGGSFFGDAAPSGSLMVSANYEFWGDDFSDYGGGHTLQTDAFSANTALGETHFSTHHVYRVEWRSGPEGFVRWSLDGEAQFEVAESTLSQRRAFSFNGTMANATMGPRTVPTEPMYVILNIDAAPQWGWLSHYPGFDCGGCECCFDCSRSACTRCMRPDPDTGEMTNYFAWFAEFCESLPTTYSIDWVRAYQPTEATESQLLCDPPSHPTRRWIAAHEEDYKLPLDEVPILAVAVGGGLCASNETCGGDSRGTCWDGACVCREAWVGPHCLSQAAGNAMACRPFEDHAKSLQQAVTRSNLLSEWFASPGACTPPTEYNVTLLRNLINAVRLSMHGFRCVGGN